MPGGYIYITRQLMALMDDEAELAFVLGHEVGHIAAQPCAGARIVRAAQFDLGRAWARSSAASSAAGSAARSPRCRSRARSSATLELLPRPGISGRHARHPLYDRRGLRSRSAASACLPRLPGPARSRREPRGATTARRPNGRAPIRSSENRVQRALTAASADRRLGHRPAQPRPVPRAARGRLRRRRSRAGHDRRAHLHPSRPAHLLRRAAGLPDAERHDARWRSRVGREGAVQRRPLHGQPGKLYRPGASATGRESGPARRAAQLQRTSINGIPAAYTTARANTSSGVGRRQRHGLSVGSPTRSIISSC